MIHINPILHSLLFLLGTYTTIFSQGNPGFHEVVSGLSKPVAITNANDGSNRLFICENLGRIQILRNNSQDSFELSEFLNISDKVDNGSGEQGLLGLAFHPKFPDSNYCYVNYIKDGAGSNPDSTIVARYSISPQDSNQALVNSERVIIRYKQDFSNHNGGGLHFGSDGYLYISSGDGGSGNDPNNRAQDTTSLLGKILRLDIDGDDYPSDENRNYSIPIDNPFANSPGADEIWSYGWRNPWRFSFDSYSDIMFVGDVGQDEREEISVDSMSVPGGNFGWRCIEGTYSTGLTGCLNTPTIDPIFEMQHGGGSSVCSVTGGYVYRGSDFPDFFGWYFMVDYCSGDLYMLNTANNYSSVRFDLSALTQVTTFGISERNELYVARLNGRIYRVIDQDHCPQNDIIVNTIDTSAYIVDGMITSDAIQNAFDTVLFSALEAVNLESGFEIPAMSIFTADNVGCIKRIVNQDLFKE